MVEIAGCDDDLAHEVALHIAFAKPTALSRDEIDADLVGRATEGFEELTRKEGKPERVLPEQGMFGEKETVQQKLGDGHIVRFAQAIIGH